MTRNFIKAREYIVVFAIALAMIITGSFVDLGFSKAVYSYTETNLFGVIMSGLAEAPTYLTMSFAGLLLIISCKELPGFKKVISIILGAAAIAFGAVMTFNTFTNIAEFYRTEDYEKLIIAIGIVFDVLMHGLISLYIFKKCLRKNRDNMRMIAIALLSIIVGYNNFGNIFSYDAFFKLALSFLCAELISFSSLTFKPLSSFIILSVQNTIILFASLCNFKSSYQPNIIAQNAPSFEKDIWYMLIIEYFCKNGW